MTSCAEVLPAGCTGRGALIGVTGANGFAGRAICFRLGQQGFRVRAIVRKPGKTVGAGETRTSQDFATDAARLVDGCDAVVHCAARVHVTKREAPAQALAVHRRINRDLAVTLASAARADGASCFVQISSVAAVATTTPSPEPLNDGDHLRPSTPYGIAKLEADEALRALAGPGFRVVSLRPPALYGPGVGAWFALLLGAARMGLPLPLGRISNRRSFAFVGNLADAVRAVVAAGAAGPSGAYIVTDSEPIATAELYRRLLALHGRPDLVWHWPAPAVRRSARALLGSRASSLIGHAAFDGARFSRVFDWRPPVPMATALRTTALTGR